MEAKDLHKRLEEAAKKEYRHEICKDKLTEQLRNGVIDLLRKTYIAGAELGYKEAIKVAKAWLSKQESWDYYDDKPCKLMTDDKLADFENDMNKLFKE